jgi:hypothetical protein
LEKVPANLLCRIEGLTNESFEFLMGAHHALIKEADAVEIGSIERDCGVLDKKDPDSWGGVTLARHHLRIDIISNFPGPAI